MKPIRMIALLTLCALLLVSCTLEGTMDSGADAQWLAQARLDADEGPEELYRAALEEDILQIYTNTTRILEVKKTFESRYPGLVVEVTDIRGGDILRIVAENHNAGEYTCDLIVCTDESGIMSHELIPAGVLHKYVPPDFAEKILPPFRQDTLVFLREAQILFYNAEANDAPPVSNWWELTEPRFRRKVYMENPLKSDTMAALLCMFLQQAEEMEAAYEALYGEPLEIPEGSDAGREFIRRLVENSVVFANSNAEISQAVGTPGQAEPPVGIMISSRIRNNGDLGYQLAPIWDMEPFAGVHAPNSIMMVDGARSVNSAKLFVRWLLGESDGTGEGYRPYLRPGIWSVRTDVKSEEPTDFAELNLPSDKEYFYSNREAFEAFWLSVMAEAGDEQAGAP